MTGASDRAPACPLCGAAMRRVEENCVLGRDRWHCPACQHEEARPQRWCLVVWRRDSASGSHEAYRRMSFRSRAAACAWLERHVLAGRVTWFDRDRRCSVVVGPGGVTP